ncbi:hypothetical protein FOB58_004614 [Candida parapsilosis]|uniref:Uncharacterized protein n=2 Tax=Candida parapsilosis TaxID=5480 RepID=G8B8W5_CANPC|nr:uncharacterized protein CPAR2_300530 [Candida parapsilosis]KAF6046177.1 hypothetical protein FOB58_004614 [Candida parapsilosis]KAF6046273.1 hypothetical protein FOB59_003738 [Candida parapsilosis]KAF6051286.1 hypothetical protein FOB60_003954 [Candida parapsilosis]KAF6061991.1 hypothetical protein FOB61_003421 [Candida parapsilosis]KAI5910068.1 hypothetical protein K4G61_g3757 [Candida parapsilosis]
MSFNKIPPSIRRLINLYQNVTHQQNTAFTEEVESFLQNTSEPNLRNKRWAILGKNARKGTDWKIDRNRERRLYQDPIQFGPNELKQTKYLFKDQSQFRKKDGLLPKSPNARKNSSVYGVDIESAIQSYFNPLVSIPVHKSHQQIFKFYLQRLMNAPIIIILKQKCDLFSTASLDQWDQSYFDLRNNIRQENERIKDMELPVLELSKVAHPDILSLALKSENYMKNPGGKFEKLVQQLPWNDVKLVNDDLANQIEKEQQIKVSNVLNLSESAYDDPCLTQMLDELMQMIERRVQVSTILKALPYNLTYNKFYMLNILNLDADFTTFDSLWSNANFEVIGARLALGNVKIRSLLQSLITTEDLQHASSYEDILKLAKLHDSDGLGLNSVMQTIASTGLTHTNFNSKKDALYLTKGD